MSKFLQLVDKKDIVNHVFSEADNYEGKDICFLEFLDFYAFLKGNNAGVLKFGYKSGNNL